MRSYFDVQVIRVIREAPYVMAGPCGPPPEAPYLCHLKGAHVFPLSSPYSLFTSLLFPFFLLVSILIPNLYLLSSLASVNVNFILLLSLPSLSFHPPPSLLLFPFISPLPLHPSPHFWSRGTTSLTDNKHSDGPASLPQPSPLPWPYSIAWHLSLYIERVFGFH